MPITDEALLTVVRALNHNVKALRQVMADVANLGRQLGHESTPSSFCQTTELSETVARKPAAVRS